jgi:archaemetzincin
VPPIFAKIIAAHLTGYLRLEVKTLPPVALTPSAFIPERHQYNAAAILNTLENVVPVGCLKLIGVTVVDLCIPIFTHVFGEARQNGRTAVVSTFRMATMSRGSTPTEAEVYERVAKVALHELGHLFNLIHCDDKHCLMHFSGNLNELDRMSLLYCRYCRSFLQNILPGV